MKEVNRSPSVRRTRRKMDGLTGRVEGKVEGEVESQWSRHFVGF